MAKNERWFVCDLKEAIQAQVLNGNVFSMDNNGSRIGVKIFDGGEKATVSGAITANCILPDGSTVNVNGTLTTVDGQSVGYIDVPQSCLLITGPLKITIKLTDSGVITTLAAILTTVYQTKTDNVITPSAQIINDWNAEISAAIATQNAAIANQDTKINDLKSALDVNHITDIDLYRKILANKTGDDIVDLPQQKGSSSADGCVYDGKFAIKKVEPLNHEILFNLPCTSGKEYLVIANYIEHKYENNTSNIQIRNGSTTVLTFSSAVDGRVNVAIGKFTSDGSSKIRLWNTYYGSSVFKIYGIHVFELKSEQNNDYFQTQYTNKVIPITEWEDGSITGTGEENDTTGEYYHRTDYIEVFAGAQYSARQGSFFTVNLYDRDKVHVSKIVTQAGTTSFTISQNGYVRITAYKANALDGLNEVISEVVDFNRNYKDLSNVVYDYNKTEAETEASIQRIDTTLSDINRTATSSTNGLMSAEDKRKLDGIINPGSITIEGSGVYKNASAYNFLPTNTAAANSTALQNVLNGGGYILVDVPGTYKICASIKIDSNTDLVFAPGVYIELEKNGSNQWPRYPFINSGAFSNAQNENITIRNLNLITNGCPIGTDVEKIYGQNGFLAFKKINHLHLDGITILDSGSENYNIHIQEFNDVVVENVIITSEKDGIHFGSGENFIIRHCFLKTNDDAIALNAHDYPGATAKLGWIKNGIIEDIHLLAAPNFNASRGLYSLGGSWVDWESGMSFRTYGDAVASNNRIYRTMGTRSSQKPTLISTVQPTHTSGTQTYSDGLTWLMAQDTDIVYNVGIENVHYKDIFIERASICAVCVNFDDDEYSRSYYPGSTPPLCKNIMVEDLHIIDGTAVSYLLYAPMPVDNMKFKNCDFITSSHILYIPNVYSGFPKDRILMDGTCFRTTASTCKVVSGGDRDCEIKIVNSFKNAGTTMFITGTNVDISVNDIGID